MHVARVITCKLISITLQAMTCLEATSQHLNKSLTGREDLLQKMEDLQQALVKYAIGMSMFHDVGVLLVSLYSSESQRIQCVEKCGQLSQECFKQEVCQETLRERIKEVEAKIISYKYVNYIRTVRHEIND